MALGGELLDVVFQQRVIWRWARASTGPARAVPGQRKRGSRLLLRHLGGLILRAEERMAMPRANTDDFPRPHNADWAWRPELWREPLSVAELGEARNGTMFGNELKLFHDCAHSGLTLRQLQSTPDEGPAPYGFCMDISRFDGTFLSLVVDLPQPAIQGLKRTHLLRMHVFVEAERPMKIFIRANIKHGPNIEQIVRELPLQSNEATVEFDLAYTELREKRIEKAWIDLIFDAPKTNRVTLRDLTFARRPRAAF